MKDTDRIIGKLEEFQEWSKKEFITFHETIEEIKKEIALINKFRWILYGKGAVLYSLILLVVEVVLHKTLFAGM